MAATNQKVMEMVREALKKNPKVSAEELYKKAQKIDRSVKGLTLRQFHARYPLQVKRKLAAASGRPRRRKVKRAGRRTPRSELDRAAIREGLLSFARDMSAAQAKGTAEVIDVLTGVDKYVDGITQALGKARG
ncbi:MAG: hypothetical protein ACE5HP_06155 [Gemmatimonadota bacterium]